MPPSVIRQDRNGLTQFILGFLFGVIVFVLIAAAATLILRGNHYCSPNRFSTGQTNCIPAFEYSLLKAASWGPVSVLSMSQAAIRLTEMQWQVISAGVFGLLGAILFVIQSRRSPMELFLIIYLGLILLTAFIILMLVTNG